MAKATRIEIVKTEPLTVKLELTEREAGLIYELVSFITGVGKNRTATRAVYQELNALGIKRPSAFAIGVIPLKLE